jgi:hypothetical protein
MNRFGRQTLTDFPSRPFTSLDLDRTRSSFAGVRTDRRTEGPFNQGITRGILFYPFPGTSARTSQPQEAQEIKIQPGRPPIYSKLNGGLESLEGIT